MPASTISLDQRPDKKGYIIGICFDAMNVHQPCLRAQYNKGFKD
jgi:hypothetical protein